MNKKLISFVMILFLISIFFSSLAYCANKTLYLSISGGNEYLKPTDLIQDENSSAYLHKIYIYSSNKDLLLPSLDLYSNDEIIFEINIDYPEYIKHGSTPLEISRESYEYDILNLMDTAADDIITIVQDFRSKYPNGEIKAISSGMGGDVLLRVLSKNIKKFSKIVFYFPTLATANDDKLITALKNNGYSKNDTSFISYDGDPTIPKLEELKTNNIELLKFFVIEALE